MWLTENRLKCTEFQGICLQKNFEDCHKMSSYSFLNKQKSVPDFFIYIKQDWYDVEPILILEELHTGLN